MKRMMMITAVAAMLMMTSLAWARPGFFEPDPEMRELHTQATALALIHHLDLTSSQRAEIKGLLDTLRPEIESLKATHDGWRDDVMKDRLKAVISDLKKGQRPDAPSADLQAKHDAMKQEMMDLKLKTESLLEQVIGTLTEEQKQSFRAFRPEDYIGFKRGGMFRKLLDKQPLEMIREIRSMDQQAFDQLKARMSRKADRMGKRGKGRQGKGMRGQNRGERMKTLVSLMETIRSMPDTEFEQQAANLSSDLSGLLPPRMKGEPCDGPGCGREMGPGMGRGRGPGKGMGPKGHGRHKHKIQRVIFSDSFYNAL